MIYFLYFLYIPVLVHTLPPFALREQMSSNLNSWKISHYHQIYASSLFILVYILDAKSSFRCSITSRPVYWSAFRVSGGCVLIGHSLTQENIIAELGAPDATFRNLASPHKHAITAGD